MALFSDKVLYYDLETTGLDINIINILQLCILNTDGTLYKNIYIYPPDNNYGPIEIHNITEQKIQANNGIQLEQLKDELNELLNTKQNIYWVAYNNFCFDQLVLEIYLKKNNINIPSTWYFVDLYPPIVKLYPNLKYNGGYKLSNVYKNICENIEIINFHDALNDTIALYNIHKELIKKKYNYIEHYRPALLKKNIDNISIKLIGGYIACNTYSLNGIYTIGDLYNKFILYDINEFKEFLINDLRLNTRTINNYINQMTIIN